MFGLKYPLIAAPLRICINPDRVCLVVPDVLPLEVFHPPVEREFCTPILKLFLYQLYSSHR